MVKFKYLFILLTLVLININTYASIQTHKIEGSQLVTSATLLEKGYETFYSEGIAYEINLKKKLSLKVFHNSNPINIRNFLGTVNGQDSIITLDSQGRIIFDIIDTSTREKKSISINRNSITVSDNIESQVKIGNGFINRYPVSLSKEKNNRDSNRQEEISANASIRTISIDVYVANDITDSTDDIFVKSYKSLASELERIQYQKYWKTKLKFLFDIHLSFYRGSSSSPINSYAYKNHKADDVFKWFRTVEKKNQADFYQFLTKNTLQMGDGANLSYIADFPGSYSWVMYMPIDPSIALGNNLNAISEEAKVLHKEGKWCETRMYPYNMGCPLRTYCDSFSSENLNRIANEILRRFSSK